MVFPSQVLNDHGITKDRLASYERSITKANDVENGGLWMIMAHVGFKKP